MAGGLTAYLRVDHQRTIDRQRLTACNGQGAVQCTFPAPALAYAGAAGRITRRCFSTGGSIAQIRCRARHHQRHTRGDGQIGRNSRILGQKHRVAGACCLHHRRKLAQLTLIDIPRCKIFFCLIKLGNQRYPLFGHAGIGVLQRQQLVAAVKPAVELAAVLSRGGVGLLGALRNRLIQFVTADGAVLRLVRCDAYRHAFTAGQENIPDPRGVFASKSFVTTPRRIIAKQEIDDISSTHRNGKCLPLCHAAGKFIHFINIPRTSDFSIVSVKTRSSPLRVDKAIACKTIIPIDVTPRFRRNLVVEH